MKHFSLLKIMTVEEIQRLNNLTKSEREAQLKEKWMDKINEATGQENVLGYISYLVEYTAMTLGAE